MLGLRVRAHMPGTRPEQTLLYQLIEVHYPAFVEHLAARERTLPVHVGTSLKTIASAADWSTASCESAVQTVMPSDWWHSVVNGAAYSGHPALRPAPCAVRASLRLFKIAPGDFVCPSCGACRMAEGAVLLVDEVLPREPMRQWVLSVPFALRYLFATDPAVMGQVLGIVYLAIASHLIKAAGYHHETGQTGAVTLIHWVHPCTRPCGQPAAVHRGHPADVSTLRECAQPSFPHFISWFTLSVSELAAHSSAKDCWCGTWEFSYLTFDSPDRSGFDDLLGHSIT